ncbi:N,N'-diacetylchitobiose phosphorylase [compost metagenome]
MDYSEYEEKNKLLKETLNNFGWDGEWYKRAITDDGRVIGSNECNECKIDSITQSWSIISGAGEKDKIKSALDSVEKYLVDKEAGAIKLLSPPFENEDFDPGYIKSYIPGTRENGGQYTHAATWYIYANCMLGRGNKALELYEMINPINHTKTKEDMDIYKVEPFCIPADIYTNDNMKGRGGWTWYTGSASWYYLIGIEEILGFNIIDKHIVINPCISSEWKEYSIQYKYYESVYNIKIINPNAKEKGITKILLDGVEVENKIKLDGNAKVFNIEAIM